MQYQLLKTRGALSEVRADADQIVSDWAKSPASVAVQSETSTIDPSQLQIPRSVVTSIPADLCWQYLCIPFREANGRLYVAASRYDDIALADKLALTSGRDVRLVAAKPFQIQNALIRNGVAVQQGTLDSMLREFTETAIDFCEDDEYRSSAPATQAPVVMRPSAIRVGCIPKSAHVRKAPLATLNDPGRSRHIGSGHSKPRSGMFFYTIPEGTRALITRRDGRMEILIGPRRVWIGSSEIHEMTQYLAHPGDYLIVRFRDGHQEHVIGPAEIWHDPRIHDRIERAEGLQIASKEAIVVYSHLAEKTSAVRTTTRRIVYGPDLFVPQPGEWLHTFSWHASKGGSSGVEKVPNGLVFQKLWLMPDQMYHDVHSVRTSDDAVLTIRLMIFFELVDISRMLDATHDPIGDFVNAATADVVEFTGRFEFEAFKQNTAKLNDLATYRQLTSRAQQIGYHIHTVVYRGYGAADSLQQMHNQAIEARTKLQLDRATEQQAQELESFRLESQLSRAAKRRSEQGDEVRHDLELNQLRSQSELEIQQKQHAFVREQRLADARSRDEADRIAATQQQAHFSVLRDLGVDLTAYLTQNRADQIYEFRGQGIPHVHVESPQADSRQSS